MDGSAFAQKDYIAKDEIITIAPNQKEIQTEIAIIDNYQFEEDKSFFVRLSVHGDSKDVKVGDIPICIVTIIDDDG